MSVRLHPVLPSAPQTEPTLSVMTSLRLFLSVSVSKLAVRLPIRDKTPVMEWLLAGVAVGVGATGVGVVVGVVEEVGVGVVVASQPGGHGPLEASGGQACPEVEVPLAHEATVGVGVAELGEGVGEAVGVVEAVPAPLKTMLAALLA